MLAHVVVMRMLDDPLADLKRQVEPAKRRISQFEVFHDAERVQIVVKRKSVFAHRGVESLLARMAKRWMSHVVYQRQRLHQVAIQSQLSGDGSRNLRDLDRVRQPVAKVVGVPPRENLRLGFQTPKCASMNDPVAVALEII